MKRGLRVVVGFALALLAIWGVLFRLSNYWFLVLLGGAAAVSLSVGVSDPPPVVPPADEEV